MPSEAELELLELEKKFCRNEITEEELARMKELKAEVLGIRKEKRDVHGK